MASPMLKTGGMCRSSFLRMTRILSMWICFLVVRGYYNAVESRHFSSRPIMTAMCRNGSVSGVCRVPHRIALAQISPRRINRNTCQTYSALIPSQLPVESPPTFEDDSDVDYEVAKTQIYSELKEVECVFRGVIARIFNHLVQYMKQKVAQSYLPFYIINPLGMGIGNLLNGKLNDHYITNKLGIPEDATPETFGMAYEQVEVASHFGSKVAKRCWLIRSNKPNTTRAFVLLHGWFGNMQSCLHFADALKKMGLLDTHHVLIIDLHDDVGKSLESNIGLKGVTDLYDAAAYLHDELGVKDISLYAQSVSGLSALMFNDACQKTPRTITDGDDDERINRCPIINEMDRALLGSLNVSFCICFIFAVSYNHIFGETSNLFLVHSFV